MDHNYKELEEVSELLKVLAHPVRLCIVKGLLNNGGCNVSFMQQCLDVPQSTVSQHLQKLKSAGIIQGERKGLEITYRVIDERAAKIIKFLTEDKE
ncbi:MAG: winged helix-turn-helix transcriptional regulator [Clostridiales bacterium]|uniref:ArsR/SmtB family transcription factor n=1 Tax=Clostridium sp. N3C TaxID=1776758 RepID=UPI00092DED32|nr:metalloregulator ArsR/SmtB family transcription factor [Clostridium sp. N3C]NLZ48922.1 winged helix-turn-helix transcriptional regulator [Clostridiales bacterium]SCN24318.1 Protective antigen repressor [Clostridium sp. N3C]